MVREHRGESRTLVQSFRDPAQALRPRSEPKETREALARLTSRTGMRSSLEYEGRIYGKSAYNSDRNVAYYKAGLPLARRIR